MSDGPYLENTCSFCGGPQFGVHYHEEREPMEDSWDTEEVERWILNDEGLYQATEEMRNESQIEQFFRDFGSHMDIDLDNVDWYTVFQTRMGA